MLTIRIKNRATIGNLQGPFEASILNRGTWLEYSYHLDKMVKFFGPDKSPDDVFRADVVNFIANLTEHYGYSESRLRRAISSGNCYWNWMMDLGFATANPFYRARKYNRAEREVEVVVT